MTIAFSAWWFATGALQVGRLGTMVGLVAMASPIFALPGFDVVLAGSTPTLEPIAWQ